MKSSRILIYVQHLLGVGHFKRAAVIARAAAEKGLDVTLLSGGQELTDIDLGAAKLIQLPAAHIRDGDFSTLLSDENTVVDDDWRHRRCAEVLKAFEQARPDALVIELFPFGRRQMRFELLPLLNAAHQAQARPVIICSIRDILVGQHKPGRAVEVCRHLEDYFDHVLVHADPDLVTLDTTFPETQRIRHLLTYTGYVAERTRREDTPQHTAEILVSAGGGAVGDRLLETALACRPLSTLRDRTWRFLVGTRGAIETLSSQAGADDAGVIIESARPDFPALLRSCGLSISQGGYNTVVETLQAGVPAVIVPFAAEGETEQSMRAQLLAERGLVQALNENALSPDALADAVDDAYRAGPKSANIDLNGAQRTADLLAGWAA